MEDHLFAAWLQSLQDDGRAGEGSVSAERHFHPWRKPTHAEVVTLGNQESRLRQIILSSYSQHGRIIQERLEQHYRSWIPPKPTIRKRVELEDRMAHASFLSARRGGAPSTSKDAASTSNEDIH